MNSTRIQSDRVERYFHRRRVARRPWHPYASLYPADQSINAEITAANADDARDAVEAADARVAQAELGGFEAASARGRAASHRRPDQRARHEALAQLQRRDNGKPISETRVLVASAANTFRYFAACVETFEEDAHALARRLHDDERARADRRDRGDHAVEFADRLRRAEARARARRRQRGRAEARRSDAAGVARARSHLRGSGRAEGRDQRAAGQGLGRSATRSCAIRS